MKRGIFDTLTAGFWHSHHRVRWFWIAGIVSIAAPWTIQSIGGRAKTGTTAECRVASVHDGDTIRATCDGKRLKVRLYCIDTPELAQRPWGRESRDELRRMIKEAGGLIRVRSHDRDRYGRTIGELLAGGTNLNVELVRRGAAAVYRRYCPTREAEYRSAERAARRERIGIWSKPGDQQTPWQYRHRGRG